MRPSDLFARVDRLQRDRTFKIIATVVVALAALAGIAYYAIRASKAHEAALAAESVASAPADSPTPGAEGVSAPAAPTGPDASSDSGLAAGKAIVEDILAARSDSTSASVAILAAAALAIGIIWLGLGLTYLALFVLVYLSAAVASHTEAGQKYTPLIVGALLLTAAFTTLMQLVRIAFSGPGAIMAVARNVLAEATKLRLSLVFIVMLIFGLAALPTLLDAEQPLRYRVQSFLSWGTGGAYWLIALLTVLLSVATVTFDQRDKTIWQTMTKPVHAWQYVIGKWLGVWALSGVLLAVSGTGIFLFVEFLRNQPAQGEAEALRLDQGMLSEDRLLLESQVLVARVSRGNDPAMVDEEQFEKNVMERARGEVERLRSVMAETSDGRIDELHVLQQLRTQLRDSVQFIYRNIPEGGNQIYSFSGLSAAKRSSRPLLFRVKINSGSNAPDALYRVTFQFGASEPEVREVVLGQWIVIPLLPAAINDEGTLVVNILNGDALRGVANPASISFPPDGLEVSYAAGSFRANFVRVMAVLWLKLGFLAMLGVALGTFLSFPVACLVAITVLFAAEGSQFLNASLENYWTEDREGKTLIFNTVIAAIAKVVSTLFSMYAELRPTKRLVEGLKLAWGDVASGTAMLALWSVLLFFAGSFSLRRRELAIYSGQ